MAKQTKQSTPLGFQKVVLCKDQLLGIGSYGKVVKARCDEYMCAAKMIHETLIHNPALQQFSTKEQRRLPVTRFERECDVLHELRHPNIVQFLGVWHDPDSGVPVLLMELMEDSLTNFVKNSENPIPYSLQVKICHDITQALTFLHSHKIVHRDLSSNNVLLDSNQNAKVADFGMARFGDINPLTTHTMCPGADDYMPPEAVESKPKYTEKLDCFSFGVITLQILVRKPPNPGDRKQKVVIKGETYEKRVSEIKRRQNHIEEVPSHHKLKPIIKDCLKDNYDDRPSAKELCDRLVPLKLAAPSSIRGVPAEERQIEQQPSGPMRRRNVLPTNISSRERNAQRDALVPVQERQRMHIQRIPVLNAPEKRVAPAGNGPGRQPHRVGYSSCSWKIWMIISLVIVAILACQRMYMGHPVIITPLNSPKAVVSSWDNDKQLWGSYRAGVYFGMRPRIPRSLLSGMMWYVYGRSSGTIRHTCENHQLPKFGWLRHDGVSCGEQEIIDNGTALNTEFVTTPRGWTARIRADTLDSSPVLVSFFFYVYNEGSGTMAFTSTEESKGIIYGETPELKKFQMTFDERTVSNKAVYNHTAAERWSVNQIASYVRWISEIKVPIGRKKWPKILQLPGDIKDPNKPEFKPNVVIYEVTTPLPYEVDLILEFGGLHGNGVDNFSHTFNARMEQFDQKFKEVFQLKSKGYNESEVSFAKAALSNLLGSISYFFGESKVKSKDSPDVELNYWPASLYTAIPSRTLFPRGFLWNEGFHQLLVAHWDTSIVKDVIAHWLDLMNEEGWIPREQILGAEARSKVPAEFIVQRNDHANPPTFFLTLETLIEIEKRPDFVFLRRIFPRLKKWFEWYSTTQAGEMQYTYRWRGRNETTESELIPVTMASGLNDFPRASHPTFQEYHVDLRCWMTLASGVMAKIAQLLGEDSQFYSVRYKVLSDQDLLDTLHWNSTAQTYSDYGLHTSDVILYKLNVDDKKDSSEKRYERSLPSLRFVDSFGYVNLFPFFFKLVSPTSEHLVFILNKLADENILWTDYGLRSLSKQDAFYDRHNTKDDAPYWRGAIWINMNYLACRALHHYGNVEGPYRQKAEKLYNQLRSNLIRNMYREYNESGYIWEHYNDTTGRGQGTHPFTGWSSLIVLIMAEKY